MAGTQDSKEPGGGASEVQGAEKPGGSKDPKDSKDQAWPSAGTPDIERGKESPGNRGSQGSLVNDSVGAYKERP